MVKIKKAEYMLSAAWESQWPDTLVPEICLAGRSNVGKSSFINTMLNFNGLAKVSGKPGKTRTLNFFNVNDALRFVDVPGYGYAKINEKIQKSFGPMIDTYISKRENLRGMVLLVDYRHKPTQDDRMMYDYFKYHEFPVIIVATKEDKLKRNDRKKNEKLIRATLGMQPDDLFVPFSSLNKVGIDKAWQAIYDLCEISFE